VKVNPNIDLVADRLPNGRDPVHRVSHSGRVSIGRISAVAFIFSAVKPASTFSRAASPTSAGRSPPIHWYTRIRSRTAAEKFVDGSAELSLDVPQRLVNAGDGAHQHRAAAVEAAPRYIACQ